MSNSYKPENQNAVSPYLMVSDVNAEVAFLEAVFGVETLDTLQKEGVTAHASVKIDDTVVMMGLSRADYPPMPCMVHVYVPNCDETFRKAVDSGAKALMEPSQQVYGDRSAGMEDSQGIQWWIATRTKALSSEEMQSKQDAQ